LKLISPVGLRGGFGALQRCLHALEHNHHFKTTCKGEPQLGKRGLYPTLSTLATRNHVRTMMNVLAYADGKHDLIELAEMIGEPFENCLPVVSALLKQGVLEVSGSASFIK
jgi:aminopeptidase-like protein